VRHAPDGTLRRLEDEPLAVPDAVADHVAGCRRCGERRRRLDADTAMASRLASGPRLVPDIDAAWERLRRAIDGRPEDAPAGSPPVAVVVPGRTRRVVRWSWRTGVLAGAGALVLAGAGTAAALSNVFAPDRVAPVAVTPGDLGTVAQLMDVDGGHVPGGFPTPDGSRTVPFGTITWSSTSAARTYDSAAAASAAAGIPVRLASHLPPGVGAPTGFLVQPRVSATVTFGAGAGDLAGRSVVLGVGPGVLAEYGATDQGAGLPTLGVLTMARPTASSADTTLARIEAFLLSRPDVPPQLAEEVRLLGDLRTVLPVPTPTGTEARSVSVGGDQGVLVADASGAASGVIWEDRGGLLHVVAGIVDAQEVLGVADQIG